MARQRRTDSKNQQWQGGHIKSLLMYSFFPNEGFGNDERSPTFDLKGFKACWATYKAIILPIWAKHYPLTRPRAFWELDAPERRERTDGGLHPFDDPRRKAAIPHAPHLSQLYYGKPQILKYESDFAAEYETQFAYLSRLGLLMPGEKEAAPETPLGDITRPGKDVVQEILEACGPEFLQ